MKSLFPLTSNSIKNLQSFLKTFPSKIYSVEIKIKTENLYPENTQKNVTTECTKEDLLLNKTVDKLVKEKVLDKSERKIVPLPSISQDILVEQTLRYVNSIKNFNYDNYTLSYLVCLIQKLKELSLHIQSFPVTSNLAIRKNILASLIRIREASQQKLNEFKPNEINKEKILDKNYQKIVNENSRKVLSLLGYADPPKGRGVRILTIDGGGTRGMIIIEILRQIEQCYGQPIHKIFDLICGVSTGAIIAMLVGALRISIDECETYYRHVSSYLFKTDLLRGTSRLLWSHAYYDTAMYEKILKEIYGESILMATRKDKDCPHMLAISAIVNLPTLEPYLFRNYELHPSSKPLSHFDGGSSHKIWEAVRASTAAPGYFEEFTLNKHVHQDGGILINNPTAVAVHEAKLLWPKEKLQCVISLGSGRYQPPNPIETEEEKDVILSSLKHKIARLIDSATDTEMIHRLMQDMLPNDVYYRMNPILRDHSSIDENRPEKLQQMVEDAKIYLRKNEHKFYKAMDQLKFKRTFYQNVVDNINLKYKMYC